MPDLFGVQGLPFKTIQHRVDTVDAQPSHPSIGGIVVVVTGALMVSEQHPYDTTVDEGLG